MNILKIVVIGFIIIGLVIYSLTLRREVKMKEEGIKEIMYAWSDYMDSVKVNHAAYEDTITQLRKELTKQKKKPSLDR